MQSEFHFGVKQHRNTTQHNQWNKQKERKQKRKIPLRSSSFLFCPLHRVVLPCWFETYTYGLCLIANIRTYCFLFFEQ